jgi:hypothetical protein
MISFAVSGHTSAPKFGGDGFKFQPGLLLV